MDDSMTNVTPEERQLLTNIRRSPVMYLGRGAGLSELAHFLHGYEVAMLRSNVKNVRILPRGFRDYICLRLTHGKGAPAEGWLEVMQLAEPDNAKALELFWALLNEYLVLNDHSPLPTFPAASRPSHPDGTEKVKSEDLPQLAESYMRTFNGAPWWDRWTRRSAMQRLQEMYKTPGFFGLAAWHAGEPLGALLGRSEHYYDRNCFQILELWVDPAAQRRGLGQQLLRELKAFKSGEKLFLITMHGEATEGFYRENGFSLQEELCIMQMDPKK